jgi:hypothetical protein
MLIASVMTALLLPGANALAAKPTNDQIAAPTDFLGCDYASRDLCIVRPEPDFRISVEELSRGLHGHALEVVFQSFETSARVTAVLNTGYGDDEIARMDCKARGQEWCPTVLYSADYFDDLKVGAGRNATTISLGYHLDIVDASGVPDVAAFVDKAFFHCLGPNGRGPLVCTKGVPTRKPV